MLRLPAILALLATGALETAGAQESPHAAQAGDRAFRVARLESFSIERRLTLTQGDSSRPFGRQSEALSRSALDGQPAWLHVVRFETPRATTVDSTWISVGAMAPLRFRSSNRYRDIIMAFDGRRVRTHTAPADSEAVDLDQELAARPFEWNTLGLAITTLPLRPGYRVRMPVYLDTTVIWYTVEVLGNTSLTRANGRRSPMWLVRATGEGGPTAQLWISRRHRLVDQVLVSDPGASVLYERDLSGPAVRHASSGTQ